MIRFAEHRQILADDLTTEVNHIAREVRTRIGAARQRLLRAQDARVQMDAMADLLQLSAATSFLSVAAASGDSDMLSLARLMVAR